MGKPALPMLPHAAMATAVMTIDVEIHYPIVLTQFLPAESFGCDPRVALRISDHLEVSVSDAEKLGHALTSWAADQRAVVEIARLRRQEEDGRDGENSRKTPMHLYDYGRGPVYAFGACSHGVCRTRVTENPEDVTCRSCKRTNAYKKAMTQKAKEEEACR